MFSFQRASGEFNSHVKRAKAPLTRLAYSWCNDSSLADDLAQEALLKALKNQMT